MANEELCFKSLRETAEAIQKREVTSVELVEAHLSRIQRLNPGLCAFFEVTSEKALQEAAAADREMAAGRCRGPLHGIPYGVKDIFDTAGVRTTNGSPFFRDNVPANDAESVARLRRAGAVLIGKCQTHEFAAGGTAINLHFGTARNPWDPARITGGSSGGSAAAVAARLCPAALGSDTGGSIRTPAALCGVVGLKPTHGRVSLRGVCPNVLHFDHVGPLTRTAHDAGLVLQAIAGYDAADPMSRDVPVPDFTAAIGAGVRGMRLALCPDFYNHSEVDAQVELAFREAVDVLVRLGAVVETLPFPQYARMERAWGPILGAEFAEFHRPFYEKDPKGYGDDVRDRLERALTTQCDDYVRALREQELIRREAVVLLRQADALLTPSMPCTAAPAATLAIRINGREMPHAWIHRPFLTPHNLTGFPALVTPMGYSSEGLPLSLQIVGRPWEEATVLRVAHAFEEATPQLRNRRPAAC